MKRIVPRCLLAVALGVGAPMPLLWLMEATAQDQAAAKPSQDLIYKVQEAPRWLESKKTHIRWNARAEGDEDREAHLRELLSNYRRTDDEKGRSRVVEELTKVVSNQFDARQRTRESELKEVEEHLQKLRELHQRRAKEKDQIVRDRVRQLLRDADGLGWGDDDRERRPDLHGADPRRAFGTEAQKN